LLAVVPSECGFTPTAVCYIRFTTGWGK